MSVDKRLVKIITGELGQKSSDLFVEFYKTDSLEEQIKGLKKLLAQTIGEQRTKDEFASVGIEI